MTAAEEHEDFDLRGFLGEEAWTMLISSGAGSGRTFEYASHPGVMKNDNRTKMVTLFVNERGRPQRKVILKLCPPGKRKPGEPGAHRGAERSEPTEWSKRHIVSQPENLNAIFLADGSYLMFMDIAGGDSDNTLLLTELLDEEEAVKACSTVVESVLRGWNPSAKTSKLRISEMLEPRIGKRLLQDDNLQRCFAGIPHLLDTRAEQLELPTGERFAHPIALAQGRGCYSDVHLNVPVGNAHGDFHGDNIAFPIRYDRPALDAFLLLDLDSYLPKTALTHDPANLALTAADHWLQTEGSVGERQQKELANILLRPASAPSEWLPMRVYRLIAAIYGAGYGWASERERNWGGEWRRATYASAMAAALLFASRETNSPDRQLWYVRLAAQAAQLVVTPPTAQTPWPQAHQQDSSTAPSARGGRTRATLQPGGASAQTAQYPSAGSGGGRPSLPTRLKSPRAKILLAGGCCLGLAVGGLWLAGASHGSGKNNDDLHVRVATNPDTMVVAPDVGRLEGRYITQQPIERVPAPPVLRDSCAGRYAWAHSAPLNAVDAYTTFVWVEITALKSPVRITGAQINYAKNSLAAPYKGTLLTCGGKGGGNQPPNVLDADLDTRKLTFYPDGGEDPATMNLAIPKGKTEVLIIMGRTEEGLQQWNVTLEAVEGNRTQAITAYPGGTEVGDPGKTEVHKYFETAGGLASESYRFQSGQWQRER
ncbi:hypothetical protein [Streptomyces sp. NPDC087856]|uniref:hypothetical protein n=1 Tax=Streptomyces sp. NPDC087856 TaxID=3365811 RepID=UPI0038134B78